MSEHKNLHHYMDCGLDNVWLDGGFDYIESPYGEAITITDMDGLHKCIGQCLIAKASALTGMEFRFIRTELDLSQETIGELCGVNERTIRKYETEDEFVLEPANTIVRVIYRERYDPSATYEEMRKQIIRLQQLDRELFEMRLMATANGWEASDDCAELAVA